MNCQTPFWSSPLLASLRSCFLQSSLTVSSSVYTALTHLRAGKKGHHTSGRRYL
jgi:hypothetical protein